MPPTTQYYVVAIVKYDDVEETFYHGLYGWVEDDSLVRYYSEPPESIPDFMWEPRYGFPETATIQPEIRTV